MTSELDELAIFGGTPKFANELPVGQLYFPDWDSYAREMKGIFDREYYTNHGPLAREFEQSLAEFLGVRHALCVTNATVGLIIIATALSLRGKVVVPAFTFVASAQALSWAGLEPVFCDIGETSHHAGRAQVERVLTDDVCAILGINLWGGTCNPSELEKLGQEVELPVFFDSAQAFGCKTDGMPVGSFGAAEVFSFHATKIVNCAEGGCITTDDDDLAARMRNIRSSYGAGPPVAVPVTTNGRFSEAQAALGLLSLSTIDDHRAHNARLWERYANGLGSIPGIDVLSPVSVDESNWQTMSCVIDPDVYGLPRDALLQILKADRVNARRYFYPGCHRSFPYSTSLPQYLDRLAVTDALCQVVLQFPLGGLVTDDDVDKIVGIVGLSREHADEAADRLAS
jgi:dTDP-4-amino-4,6-dideoxygalactose transaminase